MSRSASNQAGDVIQFIVGGCLFGGGVFLFMNQVLVRSDGLAPGLGRSFGRLGSGWGGSGWAGGQLVGLGTPGMGLLMIPLAIGVCLLFAGSYQRWARLLVWGSLADFLVAVVVRRSEQASRSLGCCSSWQRAGVARPTSLALQRR